jgi:hypothetical protein
MVKNISYYSLSILNHLKNNRGLLLDKQLESQIPASMLSKLARKGRIEIKSKTLSKRRNFPN